MKEKERKESIELVEEVKVTNTYNSVEEMLTRVLGELNEDEDTNN